MASGSDCAATAWRAQMVLAHFAGENRREICERLGCSSQTVAKWVKRFGEEGVDGLHRRRPSARLAPVRQLLRDWLPRTICQSPQAHGLQQDYWTLQALQDVCERQTGVRPSVASVQLALASLEYSPERIVKDAFARSDLDREANLG